ncbi:protein PAL OF QUIRKY-like [Rosa sericea]
MVAGNQNKTTTETLKFLCSYGGKILLRHTDGQLRYVGGHTRVLSVDPSISFSELMVKLAEFCGQSVTLRCQLPDGDLETLITIKSDEDLANLIEEYDRVFPSSRSYKIRAILSPPKSLKQVSPAQSTTSTSGDCSPSKSLYSDFDSPPKRYYSPTAVVFQRGTGKVCYYPCHVQRTPCEIPYQHHRYHQHPHQFHAPHCN